MFPPLAPLSLGRLRTPFDDRDWLFELKLDGFRALAYVHDGTARLVSRTGYVYRAYDALRRDLPAAVRSRAVVLDGELVCLDRAGRPQFNTLLFRRAAPVFCAFDILWLDGQDVRDLPLLARKRLLRRTLRRGHPAVRYVEPVAGRGVALFDAVVDQDLEGIVAKWTASWYRLTDGGVSPWQKIKNRAYSQAVGRHELFDRFRRRAG